MGQLIFFFLEIILESFGKSSVSYGAQMRMQFSCSFLYDQLGFSNKSHRDMAPSPPPPLALIFPSVKLNTVLQLEIHLLGRKHYGILNSTDGFSCINIFALAKNQFWWMFIRTTCQNVSWIVSLLAAGWGNLIIKCIPTWKTHNTNTKLEYSKEISGLFLLQIFYSPPPSL